MKTMTPMIQDPPAQPGAISPGRVAKPKVAILMLRLLGLVTVSGCGHEESSTNPMTTNPPAESQPAAPAAPAMPANTNMPPGTNANTATNSATPP